MAEIVKKCRNDRDLRPLRLKRLANPDDLALDDANQGSGRMEDADRMSEACVSGARKNELGNSELLDSPQSLEFRCIEKAPSELIQRISRAKRYEPVNRVSDPLIAFSHLEKYQEHFLV